MSTETTVCGDEASSAKAPMKAKKPLQTGNVVPTEDTVERKANALDAALDDVRRDSKQDAELYLGECEVPHGGE
jgi:hypothetical protein